jgi:hypothetical protein
MATDGEPAVEYQADLATRMLEDVAVNAHDTSQTYMIQGVIDLILGR